MTTNKLWCAVMLIGACATTPGVSPDSDDLEQDDAKADGSAPNKADQACKVVLRTVTAPDFGNPQGDWLVWTAEVDVARSLGSATPGLVWMSNESGAGLQRSSAATPIAGAPSGFQRYRIVIDHDTFPVSDVGDDEADRSLEISLIPFVRTSGATLYDHNRVPHANYVLWIGDTQGGLVPAPADPKIGAGFQVNSDSRICR